MMGQSSILLVFCVISGSLAKPPPTFLEYKDSLGQYSFVYSAPESARSEIRSIDGSTRGSYSYVDGSGIIQSAQYTADGKNGFRVTATNLPQAPIPVEYTPEVAAARINHLKAHEAASRLAEENVEEGEQGLIIDAEKSMDSIVDAVEIENKMVLEPAMKSAKSDDALATSSFGASQNNNEANERAAVEGTGIIARDSLAKSPSTKSNEANDAIAKNVASKNRTETIQMLEKSDQAESSASIQSQEKSAEISSHSDVPVVTTSFVIPGSVNLHTRIELDQSGGGAARVSSQSSPLLFSEPSLSQGQDLDPSTVTPAGTRMTSMAEGKKVEILDEMSPSLLPASLKSMTSAKQPQEYSNAIVSGIVAPSNVLAFTYGIGIDPIYREYNPYQYFPYGVL